MGVRARLRGDRAAPRHRATAGVFGDEDEEDGGSLGSFAGGGAGSDSDESELRGSRPRVLGPRDDAAASLKRRFACCRGGGVSPSALSAALCLCAALLTLAVLTARTPPPALAASIDGGDAAASALAGGVTFVALGDWGREGGWGQRGLGALLGQWGAATAAVAVVSVGDNFYETGLASAQDKQLNSSWAAVYTHPWFAATPWLLVSGNHDWRGSY